MLGSAVQGTESICKKPCILKHLQEIVELHWQFNNWNQVELFWMNSAAKKQYRSIKRETQQQRGEHVMALLMNCPCASSFVHCTVHKYSMCTAQKYAQMHKCTNMCTVHQTAAMANYTRLWAFYQNILKFTLRRNTNKGLFLLIANLK